MLSGSRADFTVLTTRVMLPVPKFHIAASAPVLCRACRFTGRNGAIVLVL